VLEERQVRVSFISSRKSDASINSRDIVDRVFSPIRVATPPKTGELAPDWDRQTCGGPILPDSGERSLPILKISVVALYSLGTMKEGGEISKRIL